MENTNNSFGVRNIVLQPTTRCNLNCSYCYLPLRNTSRLMSVTITQKIAKDLEDMNSPVSILWHAGEPLACGVKHFRNLILPFEELRLKGKIEHLLQTNATMLTKEWCDFFKEFNIRVGVSIDGPRQLNGNRVNWGGTEVFTQIQRGIEVLKQNDIEFSVIAVINEINIKYVNEFYEFFLNLGCTTLGVNIEEREGTNEKNYINNEEVKKFWSSLFSLWKENPKLRIREFTRVLSWMDAVSRDAEWVAPNLKYDIFPTIGYNGDIVMLSPELYGTKSEIHNNFVVGNILNNSLNEVVSEAQNIPYIRDYAKGINKCRAECDYFSVCLGGQASNKYFENGDFNTTVTQYCMNSQRSVVDALLQTL